MRQSEFVRWLTQQGATFKEGAKHIKVYYRDAQTTLSRHPSKELKIPLIKAVKKILGLE